MSFFSLAFVMGAVLLLSLALEIPLDAFLTIQRTMFVVVGLARSSSCWRFSTRLARSAVGDLLVELRSEPAPTDLRERCPVRCATRRSASPIGYRSTTRGPTRTGDRSACPVPATCASVTVIDSDGGHLAALIHDPSLDEEPQLLQAVARRRDRARERAPAGRAQGEVAGARGLRA